MNVYVIKNNENFVQNFVSMHKQSFESIEKYSISVFSAYYKFIAVYNKNQLFIPVLLVGKLSKSN